MTTTTATTDSRIPGAEPYKGDDWAQSLSRWMATPLFVMGVMAVLASLALGIAGGVNIGRFFGALRNPDFTDLGRHRSGVGPGGSQGRLSHRLVGLEPGREASRSR